MHHVPDPDEVRVRSNDEHPGAMGTEDQAAPARIPHGVRASARVPKTVITGTLVPMLGKVHRR